MKKRLLGILSFVVVFCAHSNAQEMRYLVDFSPYGVGIFQSGTQIDVYLRMSSTSLDAFGIENDPTSVFIGTYQFNNSLVVPEVSFVSDTFNSLLTNGTDDYVQFVLMTPSSGTKFEFQESHWFSPGVDLSGQSVVTTTFRIDEIRTGDVGDPAQEMVNYIDATIGITAIPEPSTVAGWYGGLVFLISVWIKRAQRGFASI